MLFEDHVNMFEPPMPMAGTLKHNGPERSNMADGTWQYMLKSILELWMSRGF